MLTQLGHNVPHLTKKLRTTHTHTHTERERERLVCQANTTNCQHKSPNMILDDAVYKLGRVHSNVFDSSRFKATDHSHPFLKANDQWPSHDIYDNDQLALTG